MSQTVAGPGGDEASISSGVQAEEVRVGWKSS